MCALANHIPLLKQHIKHDVGCVKGTNTLWPQYHSNETNKHTLAVCHVAVKSRYYEAGMLTPTDLNFSATYSPFCAGPLTSAHSNHGTERTVR